MGLDPQYLYDNADVVFYGNTYNDAINALKKISGQSDEYVNYMLNAQYGAADFNSAVQALEDQGVIRAYNSNGNRCFAYANSTFTTTPTGPMHQIDSNATTTTMVKGAPVYDTVVDTDVSSASYNKVLVNPVGSLLTPEHGFYGWKFFTGECVQAIGAVGAGINLGKKIDKALYTANPDFWNSIGMSSLNPDTWNNITNGDNSFAAGLFNMIFGLDPNTGKTQAFLDEAAFAYLSMYYNELGLLGNPDLKQITDEVVTHDGFSITVQHPLIVSDYLSFYGTRVIDGHPDIYEFTVLDGVTKIFAPFNNTYSFVSTSQTCNVEKKQYQWFRGGTDYVVTTSYITGLHETWKGANYTSVSSNSFLIPDDFVSNSNYGTYATRQMAFCICFGNEAPYDPNPTAGISNDPNATQPNTNGWNDLPSTLNSLQQQYPDLWNNAVPNTIVQPDGSTKTITYVPVATPQANGQWDTQPVSSSSTQANPSIQPSPQPTQENADLLKMILQLITMPEPQPDSETQPQTQTQPQPEIPSPPTTGDGESPTPVAPSGSASALWSVYHPSQTEVDSFGAWLWSSNIITQIQQVLQNPMDGIITLHKVFATPVDSGTGTIVVGRLDSQVPSATVNQQYVEVSCGSVNCSEYFGTVFDYDPYTTVHLYLPFIGIVPLNVSEVMRSVITVTYGVDVFTGACLAMVEVNRDGNTVNMYQYSGVASVEYPLTGAVHSGLLSGLFGVASGIAGIAMASTGVGIAAGATAIGAGVANMSKSQNAHASSFSGNSGAMGIKIPYLIIERPQVKTADTFPELDGYPTNYSVRLGDCSNHVVCKTVHVGGISATKSELEQIESLLKSGVEV